MDPFVHGQAAGEFWSRNTPGTMKTLATLLLLLSTTSTVLAQAPQGLAERSSTGPAPRGFFGEFGLGISNYGMCGELKLHHRRGNTLFSAGYYQSHLCHAGDYDGVPMWGGGAVTHHVSIHSYSAGLGRMLRAKTQQGVSVGLSLSRIGTETTDPIEHDFSLGGLCRELFGEGFEEHSHGGAEQLVVGIPVEYKVFLFNKRFVGLDASARVDLNLVRIFGSVTLGLRIGK